MAAIAAGHGPPPPGAGPTAGRGAAAPGGRGGGDPTARAGQHGQTWHGCRERGAGCAEGQYFNVLGCASLMLLFVVETAVGEVN